MGMIADSLLIAAALSAAIYCIVLSRKLNRFSNHSDGIGLEIKALSDQVQALNETLEKTLQSVDSSSESLARNLEKGEAAKKSLELLLASLHDLPGDNPDKERAEPVFARRAPDATSRAERG
ncbi:hypothetical protein [Meridianimarinicoccus sp. MJW13]|nr:hypothetical protein [Fluviibacterium sp. MJW13]